MKKQALIIGIGFCVLVAITAAFLVRIQTSLALGKPGVKVGTDPLYNEQGQVISTVSVDLPEDLPGYIARSGTNTPLAKAELDMLPPDTVYGRRIYEAPDGFSPFLSVVLMGADRTSIHKPQYCLIGQGLTIDSTELVDIPLFEPHPRKIQAMKLLCSMNVRRPDTGQVQTLRAIFIYWFVADGVTTPHHGERMYLMAKNLVTKGELQRWAYVASLARCYPGQEDVLFKRMKGFLAAAYPRIEASAEKKLALKIEAGEDRSR